ncbi:DNA-binding transcriptional regulator, XRE-family HTH domain [Chitinophaga sp. CF118]|uniref:helix-turn-helix domain-containing protein n=1 Tax=Chitinophaga sp. CF118 TaxID=1884367 RepID=UPI0008ECFFC2|nr:helix-turn-helix transcriptional regulator [Chitinophaga sp. CF118]SFE97946.1 DNA-binding transcriptional regulator, XRE-family HTH domain [Chitinophaga sp. CF118]
MQMTIIEIGKLLKLRREILKLKQEDLSELSGIGLRTIIKIENGEGNPSLDTLQKLFGVVGMDVTIQMKTT